MAVGVVAVAQDGGRGFGGNAQARWPRVRWRSARKVAARSVAVRRQGGRGRERGPRPFAQTSARAGRQCKLLPCRAGSGFAHWPWPPPPPHSALLERWLAHETKIVGQDFHAVATADVTFAAPGADLWQGPLFGQSSRGSGHLSHWGYPATFAAVALRNSQEGPCPRSAGPRCHLPRPVCGTLSLPPRRRSGWRADAAVARAPLVWNAVAVIAVTT
jgi:hypothetical protein